MTETSKARLSLRLSDEEYGRLRKLALDSEFPGIVNFTIFGPNTILLEGESQNDLLRTSRIVKALSLGFSSQDALSLRHDANTMMMVQLKAELPPRDVRKKRRSPRRRLLSFQALNLRVIQNFTGVSYKLAGNEFWLLGPTDSVVEASRQVRQIAKGRTRGTVQQYHRGKHGLVGKRRGHL